MSRCEYRRRFVAVRAGTPRPMVSYIISVRGCDARISAATLIVYSGLSRSSIRSDMGANASTGTTDLACFSSTKGAPSESHNHHGLDSSRVHRKWGTEPDDCAAGPP